MVIIIFPGIHDPDLTNNFRASLNLDLYSKQIIIFPNEHIFTLKQYLKNSKEIAPPSDSVVFISFSAGVVAAIAAAHLWQQLNGKVQTFLAFDGWGVPLIGNFPIYRVSHDYFTHWSSALLGTGQENFYADPAVEHLEIWRSPATVEGYWVTKSGCRYRTTLADFVKSLLQKG